MAAERRSADFEAWLAHALAHREPRDTAWYSVISDEWPKVKVNLERRLANHAR